MSEPGSLDNCDGNMNIRAVYDSVDFENSPAQDVYAPVNGNMDHSFGEWTDYVEKDSWNEQHQVSGFSELIDPFTQSHWETSEHLPWTKVKIVEFPSPWQILHTSFPVVNTPEDVIIGVVEPLSQLLQKSSKPPPLSSSTICDAASLWSCLLRELNEPDSNPCPNICRGLHCALKLSENASSCQSAPLAEERPAEIDGVPLRPPAGPLIQTKLSVRPHRGDAPGFLYQISRHWVSKQPLCLPERNHKKGFFF
ncbi:hypothetical protein GJAV_G00011830 [Gymnothorax javanicus]|nr:hypothetical protein GJAV_G00011830 [Gymnothorax javanicus]